MKLPTNLWLQFRLPGSIRLAIGLLISWKLPNAVGTMTRRPSGPYMGT